MTTVFYKPERFVSCDSKWTVNGREIKDIRENKFIFHEARSDGKMLVTFMAGTHVAIVLHQASIVGLITPEQYFSLYSIYSEHFLLDYDSVTFVLSSGILKSKTNSYYPDNKSDGVYSFGSGGLFASAFYYHAAIYSRKKRFKVPPRRFSNECKITGSMNFSYRKDHCSGGKVNKIVWSDGDVLEGTMLPLDPNYKQNVKQALTSTMREIHEMYTEKAQDQVVASIADKKRELKEKRSRANAYAKPQDAGHATKMTVSTAIDHIKWLESL